MVKYHVGDYIGDNKHLILEKKVVKVYFNVAYAGKNLKHTLAV